MDISVQDTVHDGETVIIKMHDEVGAMVTITSKSDQKIGKTKLAVKTIIGSPYGSVHEVRGRKLVRVNDSQLYNAEEFAIEEDDAPVGNNSEFYDSNTAQKLSPEEIHSLKNAGASGQEIIKSLISNSETWNCKTEFAQEKWLKRKQKKYIRRLRVLKCTPASLCDVYYNKSPAKICNMRSEVLAQLLSHAGSYPGQKILVCESMVGLIVGALAYRMRGEGRILAVYFGQQPHNDLVDRLNLTPNDHAIIQMASAADYVQAHGFLQTESDVEAFRASDAANIASHVDQKIVEAGQEVVVKERAAPRPHNASSRQPESMARLRCVLREGAQSLLIASKFHPLPILQEALHLLYPCSSIAVYCEFMEPLVECFQYLHGLGTVIKIFLTDTWSREFQVLPNRTHPQMSMPTSGGYILTAVYVGMRSMDEKQWCDEEKNVVGTKRPLQI